MESSLSYEDMIILKINIDDKLHQKPIPLDGFDFLLSDLLSDLIKKGTFFLLKVNSDFVFQKAIKSLNKILKTLLNLHP